NDPPTVVECAPVLDFLAAARRRSDVLDGKIAALNAALDALSIERAILADDIQRYAAVTSVIRCVPTEIFCRIFTMALIPSVCTEIPKAPWYLGQISRRWRQVALELPSLW
ncbi:hypothetical protein B0H16DRAFT_1268019, partial [Mycena metata]